MSVLPIRRRGKAYGYVTSGDRLLVFREPQFPSVAPQVPGGTLEPGESPETGIVRELTEELGRSDFIVHGEVGRATYVVERDGMRHVHDRHYFHVTPEAAWPETWQNLEMTPDSGMPPVLFEFAWTSLRDSGLELAADLHECLAPLREQLGFSR